MSLMSTEDILIIVNQGAPSEPKPGFVVVEADGSIRLSEYARKFYRLALVWYGLRPDPVEHVRDLDSLNAIVLRVQQARAMHERDIAERERRGGRVPAKARAIVHAIRFGTQQDLNAAVEHRLLCEELGDNVMPGPVRKRTLS